MGKRKAQTKDYVAYQDYMIAKHGEGPWPPGTIPLADRYDMWIERYADTKADETREARRLGARRAHETRLRKVKAQQQGGTDGL